MAVTTTINTSADNDYFDNDYPVIVAKNILYTNSSIIYSAGPTGGPDDVDSGYPAYRAYDDQNHMATQTASATANPTMVVAWSADQEMDSMLWLSNADSSVDINYHNLKVTDDAWSTDTTPHYSTPSEVTGRKFVRALNGGNPTIYSEFTGLYTRVALNSGTMKWGIKELFVGKRIQLTSLPLRPHDADATVSDNRDFISYSGIRTRYNLSRGRRRFTFSFRTKNSTEFANIKRIWVESGYGTNAIVYCDKPTTAPHEAGLFLIEGMKFSAPLNNVYERNISFKLIEQGGSPLGVE